MQLEARILCLLLLICLFLNVVKNGNFFLQVSLDVRALRLGNVLNRVLIGLELADFFALEHDFFTQLLDLLFELYDRRIEAEWLLKAHLRGLILRATDNGGTGAGEPDLA